MIHRVSGLVMPENENECNLDTCLNCALLYKNMSAYHHIYGGEPCIITEW